MKTLQNNFTTPQQSKRLLDLGLPVNSADCYYGKDGKIHHIDGSIPNSLLWTVGCIPCWSAGRLIEIFEICTGLVWQNEVIDGYTKIDMLLEDFDDRENKYHFDFSKLEDL